MDCPSISDGASTVTATATQDLILAERIGYSFSNGIYAKNRAEEEALSEGWIIVLFFLTEIMKWVNMT